MPTCFVVMGFGEKTDFRTGRKLDLNMSYSSMIKPAVEAAGLICVRADEIVHSGVIDVPMYEQLLMADVVIADVSTENANAFYELGVRHALRPYTTIVIAEEKLPYPFDVSHTAIRRYKHMGEDIGVREASRFKAELVGAIQQILAQPKNDSPVYTFLHRLRQPIMGPAEEVTRAVVGVSDISGETVGGLMERFQVARKAGNWKEAKALLLKLLEGQSRKSEENGSVPIDPYITKQLARVTYRENDSEEGLEEARAILERLNPETSNDPQVLGPWGAVHKRLWQKTRDRAHLDTALAAYERGFYIQNDDHNGINVAYLLNVRAAITTGDDSVADRVLARRIRSRVVEICKALLREDLEPEQRYWVMMTQAEAYFGIGERRLFEVTVDTAATIAPHSWMLESRLDQIERLRPLLAG